MIQVNLDVMMAKRKISLNELAKRMDLSLANLSILKNNKCRAIRFSTLSSLCEILECEAGDLLVYVKGDDPNGNESDDE
jgi:putative transcriptional regulator